MGQIICSPLLAKITLLLPPRGDNNYRIPAEENRVAVFYKNSCWLGMKIIAVLAYGYRKSCFSVFRIRVLLFRPLLFRFCAFGVGVFAFCFFRFASFRPGFPFSASLLHCCCGISFPGIFYV